MRITIMAPGSRGDVQPYVALGAGLRRAGHSVRVVTTKDFASLVTAHGLEVWPVDVDIQAAMQTRAAGAAMEGGGLISSFRKLTEIARVGAHELLQVGMKAADGSDVIVAGFGGMLVGASIAEKRGLPFVQAYNVPLTPTAAFPGVLLPWLSLWPRPISHRLSHAFTRQIVWQAARMAGNRARMELLGLPPAPWRGAFERGASPREPVLYGFSPSVLPRPADWDARVHVTGYWFADEPDGWVPPQEVVRFLEEGPPPVYIGFGSMSVKEPEATTRLVLDAIAATGRRAIVHAGWAGLAATATPDDVLIVGSVPHAWLLPRVGAIVHHGGAGTTAAAIRAGVPSVVVPFHGDQPFWGGLTHTLGVGTTPIPRRRLTATRLAAAIEEALTVDGLRQRAAELGERVRREDGVGRAVALIEESRR